MFIKRFQLFESLYIIFFNLFIQKYKYNIERTLYYINTDYIEKKYTVFVYFIYIVEEKKFEIDLKIDKKVEINEKNCYNLSVQYKLDSVLKTFFIELDYKHINYVLTFVNISIYFYNPVINILSHR